MLDASFTSTASSARSITSSVLLIVAGLGAGAIWVRSLTVFGWVDGHAQSKYKYLENGAHWAIMALGAMMIAVISSEPLEWATGGLGLLFVLMVGSSMLEASD